MSELHSIFMKTQDCLENENVPLEAISSFWQTAEKIFSGEDINKTISEYCKQIGEEAEKVAIALNKVYSEN